MKSQKSKVKSQKSHALAIGVAFLLTLVVVVGPYSALAQNNPARTLNSPSNENVNDTGFKLTVCDGPAEANLNHDQNYVTCDFNGAMLQIQHLINIAMIVGVLAAIVLFTWAGFLYVTSAGDTTKLNSAHAIFKKVIIGFIIMLSAWFVVYQLLDWLTGKSGFGALLGSP